MAVQWARRGARGPFEGHKEAVGEALGSVGVAPEPFPFDDGSERAKRPVEVITAPLADFAVQLESAPFAGIQPVGVVIGHETTEGLTPDHCWKSVQDTAL